MGVRNSLETNIAGMELKNPVIVASGTFGREYADLIDVARLGAVIPKSVTFGARTGNKPPRVTETTAGMLNSIGLENRGIEYFIEQELPFWQKAGATVIASIAGETVDEFARTADALAAAEGIAGIEINVSCPNVDKGGVQFGCKPRLAAEVTAAVKNESRLPVIVKLTPNVTNIVDIAKAVEAAGADCVSLINTLLGMRIDINKKRPVLGRGEGGLSGPAIKPVAIRMVYRVSESLDIPVIGMGGISTTEDAIEFMMAGAAAVQVGTANFVDPRATLKIIDGLEKFVKENAYDSVAGLVGEAKE